MNTELTLLIRFICSIVKIILCQHVWGDGLSLQSDKKN